MCGGVCVVGGIVVSGVRTRRWTVAVTYVIKCAFYRVGLYSNVMFKKKIVIGLSGLLSLTIGPKYI